MLLTDLSELPIFLLSGDSFFLTELVDSLIYVWVFTVNSLIMLINRFISFFLSLRSFFTKSISDFSSIFFSSFLLIYSLIPFIKPANFNYKLDVFFYKLVTLSNKYSYRLSLYFCPTNLNFFLVLSLLYPLFSLYFYFEDLISSKHGTLIFLFWYVLSIEGASGILD
jgi:hypothetical protein